MRSDGVDRTEKILQLFVDSCVLLGPFLATLLLTLLNSCSKLLEVHLDTRAVESQNEGEYLPANAYPLFKGLVWRCRASHPQQFSDKLGRFFELAGLSAIGSEHIVGSVAVFFMTENHKSCDCFCLIAGADVGQLVNKAVVGLPVVSLVEGG